MHGGSTISRIPSRHLKEKFSGNDKYRTGKPRKAEHAGGDKFEAGGASGVAAESCFGFQMSPVDFKQIWSDDLP